MTIQRPEPAYVLHHEIQDDWGNSRLKFWRVSFDPVYEEAQIFKAVTGVLEEFGLTSFVIYEVLGIFDLLIRAWIPRTVDTSDVDEGLEMALREFSLKELQRNDVDDIVRHWIWTDPGSNEMRSPTRRTLDSNPAPDYLARLNITLLGRESTGGLAPSELDRALENDIVAPYLDEGLIEQGLKFVMFVSGNRLSRDQRRNFQRMLGKRLAEISGRTNGDGAHVAHELSLYATPQGESGEYIVLGRISAPHFYQALRELIDFVIDPDLRQVFRTRPITHILASRNFRVYHDGLPVPPQDRTVDETPKADTLLHSFEAANLEFKATAYVDYNRSLYTGEEFQITDESENLFVEGVVRTVAAFLNTPPKASYLVVGALEVEPTERSLQRKPRPEISARLDGLPRVCLLYTSPSPRDS